MYRQQPTLNASMTLQYEPLNMFHINRKIAFRLKMSFFRKLFQKNLVGLPLHLFYLYGSQSWINLKITIKTPRQCQCYHFGVFTTILHTFNNPSGIKHHHGNIVIALVSLLLSLKLFRTGCRASKRATASSMRALKWLDEGTEYIQS